MARPLQVGIQLPEVERPVPWNEYVAMARTAEAAGFDSIWVGDHLLYRGDGRPERGPWEAWSLLAGLAASTGRVLLGPLVCCTAFRSPGMLAKVVATVDEMSGGRLVLGLGAGWNTEEFRAFGVPFDHRVSRFEEAFGVLRHLLSGDRVSFHGRFVDLEDAVVEPRPARRPPLMVGSSGIRMLSITLPYVDAWNAWYEDYGNTPAGFENLNGAVTKEIEQAGRPPGEVQRSACVLVVLDRAAGERRVVPEAPPLEGSAQQIATGLRELAAAGAQEAILVVTPITEHSIRALSEVLALLEA